MTGTNKSVAPLQKYRVFLYFSALPLFDTIQPLDRIKDVFHFAQIVHPVAVIRYVVFSGVGHYHQKPRRDDALSKA
jgi:hypothetical protein